MLDSTARVFRIGQFGRVSHARLKVVSLTILYLSAFVWSYVEYTHVTYDYLGFGLADNWFENDVLGFAVLALAPALWLPITFDRPSSMFIYVQYFLIYIPAMWMTQNSNLPILSAAEQGLLAVFLAISMTMMLWTHHRVPLIKLPRFAIDPRIFWSCILAVAAALLALIVVQLGSNFRLVSLADIYQLRTVVSDLIEASGFGLVKYAFFWLNGLFLPLIFARAVERSNFLAVAAVCGAYILLYGIWGAKTSLFSPLILAGAAWWASKGAARMPVFMIGGLICALVTPALLPFEDGIGYLVKVWWVSIVHMRTFAIQGLSLPQYFDFFSNHVLTFGSQITGLNMVIKYPYDYDVPRTIGFYYYGDLVTANANFWAQDGLASFGAIGLLPVTVIAAAVLWLVDSATAGLKTTIVVVSLVGVLLEFANVSLFTTLATGGLGIYIVVAALAPRER